MEQGGLAEEMLRNAIKSQELVGVSRELCRTAPRPGRLDGYETGKGGVDLGEVHEALIGLRIYSLGPSNSLEIISSSQPSAGQKEQRRVTQLMDGQPLDGRCPVITPRAISE